MPRKPATPEQQQAKKVLVKRKPAARKSAFGEGNPYRFKKKEENGGVNDPRINLKGRPLLLSDSYKQLLKLECPRRYIPKELRSLVDQYRGYKGATVNFAERIALGMILSAAQGDDKSAREIRTATEGMKLTTWQDELVVLLQEGKITVEMIKMELGEDARPILIAAGATGISSSSPQEEGGTRRSEGSGRGIVLDGEFRNLPESGDGETLQTSP